VAKEQMNAAVFRKDILVKELTAQVEANIAELDNSEARIKAFTSAYSAYTESKDKLRLQFESANVSLLELLQAERDHLESAELLLMNHKSILSAHLKQLFLLGQLNNYFNAWTANHSPDQGGSLEQ
jgi:outer membrane protein TolC